MQFVWKYIDDLMGKGLDWTIIAELLIFQSTNLVAMALPLALLLGSIMTFGTLAENYELVALKSSGLSLMRIMRPLLIFVIFISIGAFFFGNLVTPYANLKSKSLLHDIVYHKPLMEVKEGVFFNGMAGFSMRIGRKDPETERLYDVLIYDHRIPEKGNSTVIRAKEGEMDRTASGRYLVFKLYDGVSYDDQSKNVGRVKKKETPHLSTRFDAMELRIDVSKLQFTESDEERWTNNIPMQNMWQLRSTADSLKEMASQRRATLDGYMKRTYHLTRDSIESSLVAVDLSTYLDSLSLEKQGRVYRVAYNTSTNAASYLAASEQDIDNRKMYIKYHWNEWHRKVVLPVTCILLFFIGAPLGAIIKKGGLGMPVLFALLFFIIFHISSITGEKMVKSGSLEPYEGMWIGSVILLPFALFLTIKAAKDSQLFDRSAYTKLINKFFGKKKEPDHADTTALP